MLQQLQERLESLKAEFARGQERLAQLDAESNRLRETLLRISGAIQVLAEEIAKTEAVSVEGETSVVAPAPDPGAKQPS
jgi:predicted nuclease with TOPRIM domain